MEARLSGALYKVMRTLEGSEQGVTISDLGLGGIPLC